MADVNRRELEKKIKPNGYSRAIGLSLTEKGEVLLRFADNSGNEWRGYLGQINPNKTLTLTAGGITRVCFPVE